MRHDRRGMSWSGALVIIVILAVVVGVALWATGALGNDPGPEQPGEGEIIAYVHPSATVRVDNGGAMEEVRFEILSVNAIADQEAPEGMSMFSIWPKTVNMKMTFTISGIGEITMEQSESVNPLSSADFSFEPAQAFGMKVHGTYLITYSLYDKAASGWVLKDTAQRSVTV